MLSGDRPTVKRRNEDGFFSWEPCVYSPNRHTHLNSKSTDVVTPSGLVRVSIHRAESLESDQLNAYEWESRLIGADGALLSVAAGSLFLRKPGTPYFTSEYEFACVADQASENDLILMDAFLERIGLLRSGLSGYEQLCVVLSWERHGQAPAGAGRTCLETCIKLLKRKYRGINTVVIDAWPQQFEFGTQSDAAETAIARLQRYLTALQMHHWLGAYGDWHPVFPLYDHRTDPHLALFSKYVMRDLERSVSQAQKGN